MISPSIWQKLAYLSASKAVADEHRPWLAGILAMPDQRKLGALLALPNALVMATAGVLFLGLNGDASGIVFVLGGVFIVLMHVAWPSLTRRRAERVARRSGITI